MPEHAHAAERTSGAEMRRPNRYARMDRIVDCIFGDEPLFSVTKSDNGEERVRLHVQESPLWGDSSYYVGVIRPNSAVAYIEILLETGEGPLTIVTAVDLVECSAYQETYDHNWQVIGNLPNPDPVGHMLQELGKIARKDGRYRVTDMGEENGKPVFIHEDLY